MSSRLKGLVVAHDSIGEGLVRAVEKISGVRGVLTAVSNEGCDREKLTELVSDAVEETPTVIFVDLFGGSCCHAAMRAEADGENVAVVTGVNLAMLLHFVHHLDQSAGEAALAAVEIGNRSIKTVTR